MHLKISRINPLFIPIIFTTCFILNGCVAVAPLSVAGTGAIVSDERSFGVQVDDKMILTRIKNVQAASSNQNMWADIEVTVVEGRVLLTGALISHESIADAIKLSWGVKGVREVINEISVGQQTISQRANDTFIANQIRAKLLVEKNLLSQNYSISVCKGNAYVIGIAHDNSERDRALAIAGSIQGVGKVISHVILRNDPRRWNRI